MTESSCVGRRAAVTGEPSVEFHTPTPVLAERAIAAAVAGATGPDSRGDLCPLLQVQGDTVQLQRANAAQEASLSGCSAPCQKKISVSINLTERISYYLLLIEKR